MEFEIILNVIISKSIMEVELILIKIISKSTREIKPYQSHTYPYTHTDKAN